MFILLIDGLLLKFVWFSCCLFALTLGITVVVWINAALIIILGFVATYDVYFELLLNVCFYCSILISLNLLLDLCLNRLFCWLMILLVDISCMGFLLVVLRLCLFVVLGYWIWSLAFIYVCLFDLFNLLLIIWLRVGLFGVVCFVGLDLVGFAWLICLCGTYRLVGFYALRFCWKHLVWFCGI